MWRQASRRLGTITVSPSGLSVRPSWPFRGTLLALNGSSAAASTRCLGGTWLPVGAPRAAIEGRREQVRGLSQVPEEKELPTSDVLVQPEASAVASGSAEQTAAAVANSGSASAQPEVASGAAETAAADSGAIVEEQAAVVMTEPSTAERVVVVGDSESVTAVAESGSATTEHAAEASAGESALGEAEPEPEVAAGGSRSAPEGAAAEEQAAAVIADPDSASAEPVVVVGDVEAVTEIAESAGEAEVAPAESGSVGAAAGEGAVGSELTAMEGATESGDTDAGSSEAAAVEAAGGGSGASAVEESSATVASGEGGLTEGDAKAAEESGLPFSSQKKQQERPAVPGPSAPEIAATLSAMRVQGNSYSFLPKSRGPSRNVQRPKDPKLAALMQQLAENDNKYRAVHLTPEGVDLAKIVESGAKKRPASQDRLDQATSFSSAPRRNAVQPVGRKRREDPAPARQSGPKRPKRPEPSFVAKGLEPTERGQHIAEALLRGVADSDPGLIGDVTQGLPFIMRDSEVRGAFAARVDVASMERAMELCMPAGVEAHDTVGANRLASMWDAMQALGLPTSNKQYTMLFQALTNQGQHKKCLEKLKSILDRLEKHVDEAFELDDVKLRLVIEMHCKMGDLDKALRYYGVLRAKSMEINFRVLGWLLQTSINQKQVSTASKLMVDTVNDGYMPPELHVLALLETAATAGDTDVVIRMLTLCQALKLRMPSELLEKCWKASQRQEDLDMAAAVWEAFAANDYHVNKYHYHTMLTMLFKQRKDINAFSLLISMKVGNIGLDRVTVAECGVLMADSVERIDTGYYQLLALQDAGQKVPQACLDILLVACAELQEIDLAFATASTMEKDFGLKKTSLSYHALMKALHSFRQGSEQNRFTLMHQLVTEAEERNITLNRDTLQFYLLGCAYSDHVPEMEAALSKMQEGSTQPTVRLLSLLVAPLRKFGHHELADKFRKRADAGEARIAQRRPGAWNRSPPAVPPRQAASNIATA